MKENGLSSTYPSKNVLSGAFERTVKDVISVVVRSMSPASLLMATVAAGGKEGHCRPAWALIWPDHGPVER